jgi:hypothetical protein
MHAAKQFTDSETQSESRRTHIYYGMEVKAVRGNEIDNSNQILTKE